MAWYKVGTASFTNGSKVVSGSGTAWAANVQAGDALHAPDGKVYEIDFVGGDGSLNLVDNYAGTTASGQAYKIQPTQGRVRDLAAAVAQLIADYGGLESLLTPSSGNLGLNASPVDYGAGYTTLAINDSNAGILDLMAASASALRIFGSATESRIQSVGAVPLNLYTNNTLRATLSSAGNLGIGTGTPAVKLQVVGGGSTARVQALSSEASAASIMLVADGTIPRNEVSTSAHTLAIVIGGSDALLLDTAGNTILKLNTSAPSLTVNGQAVLHRVSNTSVRLSMRGSDGVTRSTDLTLA